MENKMQVDISLASLSSVVAQHWAQAFAVAAGIEGNMKFSLDFEVVSYQDGDKTGHHVKGAKLTMWLEPTKTPLVIVPQEKPAAATTDSQQPAGATA